MELSFVDGMRREKKHCDFLIKVGSEEIPVHRNILSATSDYFDAMFSHPTRENESGVVEMIGVDSECAIICVDHMYGKEVSILPEKYEPLMYAANLMQLHTLRDAIETLLEAELDTKSFFIAKRIANMYVCKELEEKCNKFAELNLESISKEDEFGAVDRSFMKKIIKSKIAKITEEEKLNASLRWVKHDSDSNNVLMELIQCVDLAKVPVQHRRYLIENESVINTKSDCLLHFSISVMDTMKICSGTERRSSIIIFDKNSGYLQCWNPKNDAWKQTHELIDDMKNYGFSAVDFGDHIYVLMRNKLFYRLQYLDERSTWERMPDMTVGHGERPRAVVVSGSIYVIGGSNHPGVKIIERYDLATRRWEILHNNTHFKLSGVLSTGEYIYIVGGWNNNDALQNVVRRFHPALMYWENITPRNRVKSSTAVVEMDEKIYVLGGFMSGKGSTFVERFDSTISKWTDLNPMKIPRYNAKAFAIDGSMYAVGGCENASCSIEKYDVQKNEWKMIQIPHHMKLDIIESVKIEIPR